MQDNYEGQCPYVSVEKRVLGGAICACHKYVVVRDQAEVELPRNISLGFGAIPKSMRSERRCLYGLWEGRREGGTQPHEAIGEDIMSSGP